MTRTLLIIVASGAILFVVCFSLVHAMGGFNFHHHHGVRDDDPGPVVTRDLAWSGGPTLRIRFPATITYTQGSQSKFTVTGPQSLIDSLKFEDGDLSSADHRWRFGRDETLTIVATSPSTHDFELSGAQDLTLKQYDQDQLELRVSGAADVKGTGRAKRLEAHLSGAGELNLGDLPVDDAVVSISGAGQATIDPKQSADISISGAGQVDLKTKPPSLHSHITGFGSVNYP